MSRCNNRVRGQHLGIQIDNMFKKIISHVNQVIRKFACKLNALHAIESIEHKNETTNLSF